MKSQTRAVLEGTKYFIEANAIIKNTLRKRFS